MIVAQRLRKGSCASARGAKRLVADAVKTARRILPPGTPVLVRMDSAFYGRNAVHAALAGGAQVSVTTRMDNRVKAAIASDPRGCVDQRSSTPTPSSTTPPGSGSPGPRSPRSRSPRSPLNPSGTRCRVG